MIGKLLLKISGGKPVSKKVIAHALGNVVSGVTAWLVARQGWHLPPDQAAEVTAATSLVVGWVAGYVAKEESRASS